MCKDTKNQKNYTKPQGPNCKTATLISFLRPAMDGGQGGHWPSAAPATRETRSTDEARNWKRRMRGPRRWPYPRRTTIELTGIGGGGACGRHGSSRAAATLGEQGGARRRLGHDARGGTRPGLYRRGRGGQARTAHADARGRGGHGPAWPMGLGGPGGRAGAGWVGPRARPNPVG
jgi:hypothetical protein